MDENGADTPEQLLKLYRRNGRAVMPSCPSGGSKLEEMQRRLDEQAGCRSNSANSGVSRPRHIQHHEFRRNAPSQWHATRPNAAGHIEILSSLPNKPAGWACAYPSTHFNRTAHGLASVKGVANAPNGRTAAVRAALACRL